MITDLTPPPTATPVPDPDPVPVPDPGPAATTALAAPKNAWANFPFAAVFVCVPEVVVAARIIVDFGLLLEVPFALFEA
jgi:hypothetical protein